jgi:hypothetical protein
MTAATGNAGTTSAGLRLRLGAEKRVRSEEELLTIPNVRVVPVPHPVPAIREGLEA